MQSNWSGDLTCQIAKACAALIAGADLTTRLLLVLEAFVEVCEGQGGALRLARGGLAGTEQDLLLPAADGTGRVPPASLERVMKTHKRIAPASLDGEADGEEDSNGFGRTVAIPLLIREEMHGVIATVLDGTPLDKARLVALNAIACCACAILDAEAGSASPMPKETTAESRPRPRPEVVGNTPALMENLNIARRAARSNANVLIQGETGTGKEVLAREIHSRSNRSKHDMVAINATAYPDTLLDSELFGCVRGGHSLAEHDRAGIFEQANGSTIFVDEIGDATRAFQEKILRVLQEKEIRRIGDTKSRKVNVRVIAATNRDLKKLVEEGTFREDLYFRLKVVEIQTAPLRERRSDIPALVQEFLRRAPDELELDDRSPRRMTAEVVELLSRRDWHGNVRELENVVKLLVVLCGLEITLSEALPILEKYRAPSRQQETTERTSREVVASLIRDRLAAHGFRRQETADSLGITRQWLRILMKRLRLQVPYASRGWNGGAAAQRN